MNKRPRKKKSQIVKSLKILVAEDNDLLRESIQYYLRRKGYQVIAVSEGKETLYILSQEKVHLLILDLMLPELDGFAVLRHVRDERRSRFPYILVISGLAEDIGKRISRELGGHIYLQKPFSLSRLYHLIAEMETQFHLHLSEE